MDKKKQYYTDEYKKLLNLYESNIDTLDEMSKKLIKDQLSIYDNAFKGDKKAIDFITENSSELKDLFEELNDSFETIHTKITNNSGYTNSIITGHSGATKEDLDKAVDAKERLDKIEEERDLLLQAISDIDSKLPTASKSEKRRLTNEKATLNNQVSKLNREEGLLKPFKGVFTDSELDGEIQNRKDLNDLTNEQIKLLNKVSLKQEEINELTVEHTKNVGAFTEMAKAAGNALIVIAKAGFEKWKEIDEKVFSVGRQIGLSSNQLREYQKNVLNNYDELASRLGMSFEELFKFQESYTKNTGRAIMLTNEQVESLGTMSKLVGDVATNDMVKNMDDFGASTQTATSYLALNMARARSQGLDAQKASETFANNVKLASKYTFREGVNGISKMTLLSQKLKFNMDSIANAAEKFETVEGAIGTAANLQMLGGTYSSQFGNPLEAMNMAMLDMEGFTQKIVDTFSGKATFNRETGQVEMSAIDKRLMREAAKQMGISYDEAWNMASQQAKIGDVERQINKTQNFSEEDKSWITSNSQYNAETKQHQVSFFENGEQKTVDVRDLTAEQLKQVKAQAISEKAIQGDVHGIHSILKAYAKKEMGDSKSWNEMQKGWQESMEINVADAEDGVLDWVKKNILKPLTDENWWIAKLGLTFGTLSLGSLIKRYASNLIGDGLNNLGGHLSSSMTKGKKMVKGLGGSIARGAQKLGGGIARGARSLGGKLMNAPGWLKIAGIALTATGIATALQSSADGSQVDKSKLGGREVEPINNENENTTTSVNQQSQELIELQKHTVLLQAIANKQGIDVKTIYENSTFNKTDIEDNSEQTTASSILSDSMNTTLMASQVGSSKIAAKGLKAVAGRSGLKMAANMGRMAKAANPLGWISLGSGVLKDISGVEEGSGVDKAWSTANATLDGAALGGMIGSVIPGLGTAVGSAVGAAVGGVVGIIDNYGEDIAKATKSVVDGVSGFLFGEDNMTEADKMQQSYEETKLGVVDITDPQLEQKAYVATCKIHDVVISMWHHMNGRQSNGLEEDKGLFGGMSNSVNNVTNNVGNALLNTVSAPFKLIGSLFSGNEENTENKNYLNQTNTSNGLIANANYQYNGNNNELLNNFTEKAYYNDETKQVEMSAIDKRLMRNVAKQLNISYDDAWSMVSQNVINNNAYANENPYNTQNYKNNNFNNANEVNYRNNSYLSEVSVKDINYNNDNVIPKVSVGLPTSIRETSVNNYNNSSYNNIGSNKLDLNVSGTIKLTSERGGNVDIDFNKLLNNTEFMNNLINIISQDFNKRVNGQRENKNSVISLQNGGYNYNIFNATTNGWA